jgi:hypothetical protein
MDSMSVRVPVRMEVAEAVSFLRNQGMELGEFHPPVGTGGFTFGDWLAVPLIPARHYDVATLLEKIVSVEGTAASGSAIRTNTAPRSATGPDLNYLLGSTAGDLAGIEGLLLRVRPLASAPAMSAYRMAGIPKAMSALGALAHGRAYFESVRFASGPAGNILSIVHDNGTELGRARKAYCERLVSAAGGSAVASAESAVEDLGGTDFFELYAPYGRGSAVTETAKALARHGINGCFLYRYGREGVSFRFPVDSITDDRNKVLIEAGRAARGRGGMMVIEGGAFGTNGEVGAVSSLLESVKANLRKAKA